MVVALVRSAFVYLSQYADYLESTELINIKHQAAEIVEKVIEDNYIDYFDSFADKLYKAFSEVVTSCMPLTNEI